MELILSRHAIDRMKNRNIGVLEVEKVLHFGNCISSDQFKGTTVFWLNDIRVVFSDIANEVITVYKDNKKCQNSGLNLEIKGLEKSS